MHKFENYSNQACPILILITKVNLREYNLYMKNLINKNKKTAPRIHFVGIGGVSMSALAMLVQSRGCVVTGVDDVDSPVLKKLNSHKIKTTIKHNPEFVKSADVIVYTVAVKNHPDLSLAKSLNKLIVERAEFLGQVAKSYQNAIAISGTHGKTTTTAMLGYIFELAKFNPTVHIGGVSQNWNSNLRVGGNEYFITEACEFNRSFLHLKPDCVCITNIECDHMDTYKDLDDIKKTFQKLIAKTRKFVVFCGDELNFEQKKSKNYLSFGFKPQNRFVAKNLCSDEKGRFSFDCFLDGKFYLRAKLLLSGKHNVLNALGCIAIGYAYHVPYIYIIEGLQNFIGVERRQTFLGEIAGVKHFTDYAHHPTEITALLETAKLLAVKGKIVTIFQPHTYTRTLKLMPQFVTALKNCADLILLPTYRAREKLIAGGDSTDLFFALPPTQNRIYCSNFQNLRFTLEHSLKAGDICLWVGAGDINKIAEKFVETQTNSTPKTTKNKIL